MSTSVSPSAKTMEEAAEQYAFYVHQSKLAETKHLDLSAKNEELTKKNSDLESLIQRGQSSLLTLQGEARQAKADLKAYEDKESPKLEALKAEAMDKLQQQRAQETTLAEKALSLDARETDAKRTELQARALLQQSAEEKAKLDNRSSNLDEREQELVLRERLAKDKDNQLRIKEDEISKTAADLDYRVKQQASAQASFAQSLGSLDSKARELDARESQLKEVVNKVAAREKALEPILGLAKEFKQTAVQFAGDSPKVLAWLDAHCIE